MHEITFGDRKQFTIESPSKPLREKTVYLSDHARIDYERTEFFHCLYFEIFGGKPNESDNTIIISTTLEDTVEPLCKMLLRARHNAVNHKETL